MAALVALNCAATPALAQSGVYNWTGFYAGLHAGGAWGETKGSDTFSFPTEITQQNMRGAFGGAQVGYNQQFGRAVWGAELSGSYGQINGSGDCFPNSAFILDPGESLNCHSRQDWSLQFLTKLGYAYGDGRLLPYITGGVVLSRLSVKKDFESLLAQPESWGAMHMQAGAGLGAGVQYALGNGYSVGIEYLYANFFNQDHTSLAPCAGCLQISDQNLTSQSLRFVLNYTFGGPPPAGANSAAIPAHATGGIYDWTGLYVGGHAGGEWARKNGSVINGGFFDQTRQNLSGEFAGAQIGYNHQFGRVVLGAELSGSWANIDNNNFCFQTTVLDPGESASCRAKLPWSVQFLTRLGYALDDGRLLPYVVGGVAIARLNLHFTDNLPPDTIEWGANKNMTGAVLGAGVQYALGNGFSLGLEYLYTRYGNQDFSSLVTVDGAFVGLVSNDRNDLTTQTLRVVANYKFGDSSISERRSGRVYDWTGFYIGANAGWERGRAHGFDEIATMNGDVSDQTIRGAFGGGQFGYNHQFGRLVLGTEFSAAFGDIGGQKDCFATAAALTPGFDFNCRIKKEWTGELLTRLGYAFGDGRMLPYILGGVAFTKLDVTHGVEVTGIPATSTTWGARNVHPGAVLGFGLQYAVGNNLSIGAEYLYTQYGMQQYTSDATGILAFPGMPGTFTQDLTAKTVRLVLNYKFDDAIFGGR